MVLLIALFGLCWGSFLNVVAYRSLHQRSLLYRSRCTHCAKVIAWYDLIPLVSWLWLAGRCRSCRQSISYLYPLIELLSAAALVGLYYRFYSVPAYFFSYALLSSVLLLDLRTDLEEMVIIRWASLGLLPFGLLLSYAGWLPISLTESWVGAGTGALLLWGMQQLFWLVRKREGLGQGDVDLLAGIGSFVGVAGVCGTLALASFLGSLLGVIALMRGHSAQLKIPFAPFLAIGSYLWIIFQADIIRLLL